MSIGRRGALCAGVWAFIATAMTLPAAFAVNDSQQRPPPATSKPGSPSIPCIPGGDETAINKALSGPQARALLCQHAVFEVTHTIVLSANGQELATAGDPSEDARAVIRIG